MNKIEHLIDEIKQVNHLAERDQWVNRIHPLVKLVLTFEYIIVTVSFGKYDVYGCIGMFIYPLIMFQLAEVSFRDCMRRIRILMPFVMILGIWNPIFDHNRVMVAGIALNAGILSMLTLLMKAMECVMATYLLLVTTGMEGICEAMQLLHIPSELVVQVSLSYRYLLVLLTEANRMLQAYMLRAPGQRGIHFRAWGSMIGMLLLRSYERAEAIYESMQLRGFQMQLQAEKKPFSIGAVCYFVLWSVLFLIFRLFPVLMIIGYFTERLYI